MEMMNDDISKALNDAAAVHETMGTDGWKIIRKVFEDRIIALDTVQGVTSVKELQARQLALKALTKFLADLDAISGGYVAKTAELALAKPDKDVDLFREKE